MVEALDIVDQCFNKNATNDERDKCAHKLFANSFAASPMTDTQQKLEVYRVFASYQSQVEPVFPGLTDVSLRQTAAPADAWHFESTRQFAGSPTSPPNDLGPSFQTTGDRQPAVIVTGKGNVTITYPHDSRESPAVSNPTGDVTIQYK